MIKQLTLEERYYIYVSLKSNLSIPKIAELLNRNKSTIYREIERNSGLKGYRYKQAQRNALVRRQTAKKRIKFTDDVKSEVNSLLRFDLSPDQISARLLRLISAEHIYQYVWKDKRNGGTLYEHLRRKNRKYHKRGNSNDRRGIIKNKTSIEERPEEIDERLIIGHWEADLVVGKGQSGYLVTITERKSNYNLIGYTKTKDAESVSKEMIRLLKPLKSVVLSITTDNGKEFANHEFVAQELDTKCYFAHAYSSWERGTNENANGLIRQYFPKSEYFDNVNYMKRQIIKATTRLNYRPRKKNGYLTPHELFFNLKVATIS